MKKSLQVILLFFSIQGGDLFSQLDNRVQYPPGLKNAYFGVNVGAINYNFSSEQLEAGYTVESVKVPPAAVRIMLYGYQFNQYLSAQISYMRPVSWVEYRNVNGDGSSHSVWMNVAGLTFSSNLPLSKRFSLHAETGLGIITRKGFRVNNNQVVRNANYATILSGASLHYHVGKKWDLELTGTWSPTHKRVKQPETVFVGAGFRYKLIEFPKEKLAKYQRESRLFPRNIWTMSYTSNILGYGVNDFASKGAIPFFWGGEAHIKQGISFSFQRNIFHTRKVFAFDWGASAGWWQSRDNDDQFFTLSVFPVLRFHAIRAQPLDVYFEYAVAGPTFISRPLIDDKQTGKKFTFYDFMGIGVFAGKKRNINLGLRIAHFSNGNIFPDNDGVKIPLTLNVGITQ
jgi:hypothetical protein